MKHTQAELERQKEIDKEFFVKAIDFIRNYADKFHHAKEEDILFIEFNKKADKNCCNPIEQMLHEHTEGRGFVKAMEEAVEEGNKEKLIENARNYAYLLQEHIHKEDNILYPMAEEALTEEQKENILKKYNQVGTGEFSDENIQKYLSFL